jgi:tetratricopeptide (TPR) repeat protein
MQRRKNTHSHSGQERKEMLAQKIAADKIGKVVEKAVFERILNEEKLMKECLNILPGKENVAQILIAYGQGLLFKMDITHGLGLLRIAAKHVENPEPIRDITLSFAENLNKPAEIPLALSLLQLASEIDPSCQVPYARKIIDHSEDSSKLQEAIPILETALATVLNNRAANEREHNLHIALQIELYLATAHIKLKNFETASASIQKSKEIMLRMLTANPRINMKFEQKKCRELGDIIKQAKQQENKPLQPAAETKPSLPTTQAIASSTGQTGQLPPELKENKDSMTTRNTGYGTGLFHGVKQIKEHAMKESTSAPKRRY